MNVKAFEASCIICRKPFFKNYGIQQPHPRRAIIRSRNSKTCSHKCSVLWGDVQRRELKKRRNRSSK